MGAYVRPYRPIQASHGVRGVSAETHVGSDAKCGLCGNLHDEVILINFILKLLEGKSKGRKAGIFKNKPTTKWN